MRVEAGKVRSRLEEVSDAVGVGFGEDGAFEGRDGVGTGGGGGIGLSSEGAEGRSEDGREVGVTTADKSRGTGGGGHGRSGGSGSKRVGVELEAINLYRDRRSLVPDFFQGKEMA